ncbi:restriction endonuclease [Caloramator sp. CAR-1]|uniref:restriction endonuclease n=1 Tax=Caloramator sp. CAR-1 TaxID=3062777 RepID=UPI0026E2C72F|nr:restriction endonuclease [Caloramator sp. CAR-1]MDO6354850.1 restriction endonuclease [Caloramator sp. CAR-1]
MQQSLIKRYKTTLKPKTKNQPIKNNQKIISFNDLNDSDLIVDALYKGGNKNNISDDPISKLLGCGNLGGFRIRKNSIKKNSNDLSNIAFVILYTDFSQSGWEDYLDLEKGIFIYYGDNRECGDTLLNTKGNQILKKVFDSLHTNNRDIIPPFFIFSKASQKSRDVIFRGLAVPGANNLTEKDDLIAVWSLQNNLRFLNYKATFTILNDIVISRKWIIDLINGNKITESTPKNYKIWVENGIYNPLCCINSKKIRTKKDQLPYNDIDRKIIELIYNYFDDYSFEEFAAKLFQLSDNNVIEYQLTRKWKDGGRDAIGKYRIGLDQNNIIVEFALEAKKYKLKNAITLKHTTRLISRLKYRQFGVLVTTSYVSNQAYKEIIEDGHPILIISAKDIVEILKSKGLSTTDKVRKWLEENFPKE